MNESIYKQCSRCNKKFLSTQIGRIKCLLCTVNKNKTYNICEGKKQRRKRLK